MPHRHLSRLPLRFACLPVLLTLCAGLLLAACGAEAVVTVTPIPPPAATPTATPPGPTATPIPAPTAATAPNRPNTPAPAPTVGAVSPAATGAALIAAPAAASAAPVATAAPAATSAPRTAAATPAGGMTAPKTTPSEPHQLPGGTLSLPPGWDVSVYAQNLGVARFMAVRPSDGTLFVADANGRVLVLSDSGTGPDVRVFASGLNRPTSVAFYQDWVYVGETNAITRFRAPKDALVPIGSREVVVPDLPSGGNHWTRTVVFGPDGRMYVAIGSSCNVCEEQDNRRAAIMVYDPDGKNGRLFATGLRNAVGVTFEPGSGQMWATVNGRDGIGDDIPPDDLRTVNDGTFYGWPYCYAGKTPNPEYRAQAADKCRDTPPNARSLQAHSAALGLTFGDGLTAPQVYRDSIYIAYHGSWNRSTKTGYKVVRVPFVDGKAGQAEDFAIGWLPGNADSPGRVWGRPVGVTVGKDGALYVSDDSTGTIYRLSSS